MGHLSSRQIRDTIKFCHENKFEMVVNITQQKKEIITKVLIF